MSESEESVRLRALTDQLRAHNAQIRQEITPEWIKSLPPEGQAVILADLLKLQETARRVLADIESLEANDDDD